MCRDRHSLDTSTANCLNPLEPPSKIIEGSGKSFNTIPLNDFSYFKMINELVQQEPAEPSDRDLLGEQRTTYSQKAVSPFRSEYELKIEGTPATPARDDVVSF